jgi:hypothetical protein
MTGRKSPPQLAVYSVIGRFSIEETWNGSPLTLNPSDNANMPITPNGSLILAYQNISTINTMGQIAVTSGGSAPTFLNVQSLQNQPSVLINNWQGSNLSITNTSPPNSNTPISIAAYGPGMPGQTCVTLPADGTSVPLAPMACTQGMAAPRYMQLIFQETSGDLAILVFIGGPMDSSGNNAYMVSVNDSVNGNTGPGTGQPPPTGYYATTKANSFLYSFNWGSSTIYVANMSPASSEAALITLRKL